MLLWVSLSACAPSDPVSKGQVQQARRATSRFPFPGTASDPRTREPHRKLSPDLAPHISESAKSHQYCQELLGRFTYSRTQES